MSLLSAFQPKIWRMILVMATPNFLSAGNLAIVAQLITRDRGAEETVQLDATENQLKMSYKVSMKDTDKDGCPRMVFNFLGRLKKIILKRLSHEGKSVDNNMVKIIQAFLDREEIRVGGKTYYGLTRLKDIPGLDKEKVEVEVIAFSDKQRKSSTLPKVKGSQGDKKAKDDSAIKMVRFDIPEKQKRHSAPPRLFSINERALDQSLPPITHPSGQKINDFVPESAVVAGATIVVATGLVYKFLRNSGQPPENRGAVEHDKAVKALIEKAVEELLKIDCYLAQNEQESNIFEFRWRLMNEVFKNFDAELQIEVLAEYEKKRA